MEIMWSSALFDALLRMLGKILESSLSLFLVAVLSDYYLNPDSL